MSAAHRGRTAADVQERDPLVAAWPGFKHGVPGKHIFFQCPVCDSGEVTYYPYDGHLICASPARCEPKDIVDRLRGGQVLANDPKELLRRAQTDATPTAAEVIKERRRIRARRTALDQEDEADAADLAEEWFGASGDQFDPDTPEPVPCVLEFAPGRFAFGPGINFLFGTRSSLKTWLAYFAVLQEVRRGNRALILDYELSFEVAMRRLHTLGVTAQEASRVVYVQPSSPITDAGRVRLLNRFDEPPSLVVIDSTSTALGQAGLDTNDLTKVTSWIERLPRWIKKQWPGTVNLLIDHVPKGSETTAVDPIGSQGKAAQADGLLFARVLETVSKSTRGGGRVTVRKDRQGWSDEGQPLFDYAFGGGGPFELSAPDPDAVPVSGDLGDAAEVMMRVAVHVGQHEGTTVEASRSALDIHPSQFTGIKNALVSMSVIVQRRGLFKGERWQSYVDGSYESAG